jgi:hypothetical protein
VILIRVPLTVERELKIKPIYECRCDERLLGELEHLKIKTRLIDEKFASVMGECVS